jgi:dTMP kinase
MPCNGGFVAREFAHSRAPVRAAACGEGKLERKIPQYHLPSFADANVSSTSLDQRLRRLARAHFEDRSRRRGLLVAFEGPDGSGKTTQRKLFKTWLTANGYDVVTTKWNSSQLIRPIIKTRKAIRVLSPLEFSLLHAADFRHRIERVVLPALWEGKLVIADRFLFTGLARDVARGLDFDQVLKLYQPLLWPDLVFYFSVSARTSRQRIAATRTPKFYEAGQDVTEMDEPTASYERFITRVIREYESLALIFRFVTVDAEQSIHDQHQRIRKLFREGEQRPWSDWNLDAVAEWLATRGTRL